MKKLLILGSSVLSTDIIKYAKSKGVYTIVTDYYTKEKSPAKRFADETWDVSTDDTETLIRLCNENDVKYVFAGVSEFNLIQAMKVKEGLGARFYFSSEQWKLIENKDRFRKLCLEYGVTTPQTYFIGIEKEYKEVDAEEWILPVIVKPVDCCASDGISICHSMEVLEEAVKLACSTSPQNRIIIEQYVEGEEFTAHYVVDGDKVVFSSIDNRYPISVHSGSVTTIPAARIYPSKYIEKFKGCINDKIISLIRSLGVSKSIVFFQGIYESISDRFYIFEAGLRTAAEAPCRFTEYIQDQNAFNMMIDDALDNEESSYSVEKEDPYMGGKTCGIISVVSSGGKIGSITGVDEVARNPKVIGYEKRYDVGDSIPQSNSLRQIAVRFLIVTENRTEMRDFIAYINKTVKIESEHGDSMVIYMEPDVIL